MLSAFSDALNWLEALVSSVSLVCAIEDSISRISDLAMAVKKFAYDERSPAKELDVHDSLQSTLIILGHKLRIKQIQVEKRFEASPSTISYARIGIEPGVDEPDRQCGGRLAFRRTDRNCNLDGSGSRLAHGKHYGSRDRNSRRCASTNVRGVFHHETAGCRNGVGSRYRASDRHGKVWRQN